MYLTCCVYVYIEETETDFLFDPGKDEHKHEEEEEEEEEDDDDDDDDDDLEDGELEGYSSSYRVLSGKTLAGVVEACIGVYYVEGGKQDANHLMKWIGIEVEFDANRLLEFLVTSGWSLLEMRYSKAFVFHVHGSANWTVN
ncbi:hypothetical protein L2E82_45982 [Cichorium intybus]|uniref:Uncharacterized protein n=1 Tax=Cichorium intybus TaxID=13427 RepID=A0ACB8ZVV8_CICIN|nr:hypothetical protein L2E82_45982 [Cichorium intybus]